jgi:hypothetical protein
MRLDRWLTLLLFRMGLGGLERRLPVLMYHSVSDDPETGIPYYRVSISPSRFAQHMEWLSDSGYSGVSLQEGYRCIRLLGSAQYAYRKIKSWTDVNRGRHCTQGASH